MNVCKQSSIILAGLITILTINCSVSAGVFNPIQRDRFELEKDIIKACSQATQQVLAGPQSASLAVENSQRLAALVTCRTFQQTYEKRLRKTPEALKEAAYLALEQGTAIEKIDTIGQMTESGQLLASIRNAIYSYLFALDGHE